MKIITLKENLDNGLNIVNKVTGKNLTLPILNNILISTEKNFLNLSATDLELGIKHWFLVKTEKEGKVTVPAKTLSGFISFLPDQKITLEEKNNFLYIDCENHSTKIKTMNADDFPIIPKIDGEKYVELNCSILCEALSQVVDFSTPNQNRPDLSGIYFNFQKDSAKLVATDGFRLAEKTLLLENKTDKTFSFILPQKTAREIINIFSEKEGKIRLYFSPNQILFEYPMEETPHPQTQVVSRLIEGDYPDYQGIIPKQYEAQLILEKEGLLNQIKTASIFSGRGNEVRLRIDDKKEGVEVFSQDPDLGDNKSFLAGKIRFSHTAEKKEMEVVFNYKFLADGLASIKSRNIILELNGEEKPAAIKPEDDPNHIYVVMPIYMPVKS